jgi:uncharacterized zinc-type alcohol dehydrogenase-like protein
MIPAHGYAAQDAAHPLAPFNFNRRDPGPRDVQLDILYCGVCHSDLHMARNEWGFTTYPIVPGHEIVGRVTSTGRDVTRFKTGDIVGVGCLVDSCRTCASCRDGDEQYCETGFTLTYNSPERQTGRMTYGGYSNRIVVDDHFVLRISPGANLPATAPLLCAGITTYSPMRHWNVSRGQKVGVVGLGGLGHMGVKFAHAFGAHTVLFTTSPSKVADGKRLGADEVTISTDTDQMQRHAGSFDFILDTVSAPHNLGDYLNLLRRDGVLCLVGLPDKPHPEFGVGPMLFKRLQVAGSLIGGLAQTQEMLDYCAAHNIVCDIEMIAMHDINTAYARMLKSDVRYRFVIDMATLRSAAG